MRLPVALSNARIRAGTTLSVRREGALLQLRDDRFADLELKASPAVSTIIRAVADGTVRLDVDRPDHDLILALALEGLVQIEVDDHGWLSGLELTSLLPAPDPMWQRTISGRAVRHARGLRHDDVHASYAALYRYNTEPAAPGYPLTADQVSTLVEPALRALEIRFGAGQSLREWMVFGDATGAANKVYVSPRRSDLGHVVTRCCEVLDERETTAAKVACTAPGVSRPDNLVYYVRSEAGAGALAETLATVLEDVDLRDVPFTLPPSRSSPVGIGLDGMDVAVRARDLPGGSWRSTICQIIARALRRLDGGVGDDAALAHVAALLSANGIDCERFGPTGAAIHA